MGIHAAFEAGGGIGPDLIHQLGTGKHPFWLRQQGFENQILVAGQNQGIAPKADGGANFIDLESALVACAHLVDIY